jgi:predicted phosphodiesterase
MTSAPTPKPSKLERIIEQQHLTEEEAIKILKGHNTPKPFSREYDHGGKEVLFTLISDTHIGHECYDPGILEHAVKNSHDVDFVLHGGDIIEGHYESHRPGHVFELTHLGADEQIKYASEELSKFGKPLFFIEGNHMANTFYKNSGYDVGKAIADKVPNSTYLGIQGGTIKLDNGKRIQLIHPDGGSSYAISYKSQKIVESLEGGTKPEFLSIGHFHKAEYLFYRNVHVIQNGCLERQTAFMRNKGLSAHCGYWKVHMKVNKRGISEITPTFYPFY